MSNTDSFIDEVSEELRRDQFYRYLRRYGWMAIAAVVVLVGTAAIVEYRRAQDRAQAQAFGDAVVAALALEDTDARRAALLDIDVDGTRRTLIAMLAADRLEDDTSRALTAEELDAVAADDSLPQIYRELAVLKSVMIAQADTPPDDIVARLEPLTIPGAPYRLLAIEQQAIADLRAGNTDDAIGRLQTILADGAVTRDLRQRARQLIVALGGTLDAA